MGFHIPYIAPLNGVTRKMGSAGDITKPTQVLAYADYLVIISRNTHNLISTFSQIEKEAISAISK